MWGAARIFTRHLCRMGLYAGGPGRDLDLLFHPQLLKEMMLVTVLTSPHSNKLAETEITGHSRGKHGGVGTGQTYVCPADGKVRLLNRAWNPADSWSLWKHQGRRTDVSITP